MTEASRRDVLPFRQILESLRRIYFTIKKLTEGCRRDVLPFCKVTEGRRKDVWAFCKLTEGCRKDVLPFCKVTEGRRKMFEHSVKLQKVVAKMFDLSVRKKGRKIKSPASFFLLSEGFSLRF